ncbi:MAG: hypothetical protein JW894_14505 [Bacteroidales bacterium]|nr:hypothetical protein [Bacteroidales bacterium]
MKVAILDLGTNTFNLVVAEKQNEKEFRIIHSSKLPVKLGEGGINRGEITQQSYDRGIGAVLEHYKVIKQFEVSRIRSFGTSGLRSASNGVDFISAIKAKTGIDIEIISGDLEAELIYYGVRQTIPSINKKYVILDIGGGSNELIIADNQQIYWKKSYELGIARLLERFSPSDPITKNEVKVIRDFIRSETGDLIDQAGKYNIDLLIGASGSFETFVAMIEAENNNAETETGLVARSVKVKIQDFEKLHNKLIHSTIEERKQMKGLEPMRIEMIVLASVLVNYLKETLGIKTIMQSNFSLKEGAIYRLMTGYDE